MQAFTSLGADVGNSLLMISIICSSVLLLPTSTAILAPRPLKLTKPFSVLATPFSFVVCFSTFRAFAAAGFFSVFLFMVFCSCCFSLRIVFSSSSNAAEFDRKFSISSTGICRLILSGFVLFPSKRTPRAWRMIAESFSTTVTTFSRPFMSKICPTCNSASSGFSGKFCVIANDSVDSGADFRTCGRSSAAGFTLVFSDSCGFEPPTKNKAFIALVTAT